MSTEPSALDGRPDARWAEALVSPLTEPEPPTVATVVVALDGGLRRLDPTAATLLATTVDGQLLAILTDPAALHAARLGVPSSTYLPLATDAPTLHRLGNGWAAITALHVTLVPHADGAMAVLTPAAGPTVPTAATAVADVAASASSAASLATGRRWLDDLPAMVAYLDLDGHWLAANRVLVNWLGYASSDLRQRPLLELCLPASRPVLAAGLARLREHQTLDDLELRLVDAAGQVRDVELSAVVVRDAVGRPVGICAILHDLSDRVAIERSLESYTHELEQLYVQVERRTAELEAANEALRQARLEAVEAEELARLERMKTAVLDVAAHELRTPVTLITGVLAMLARQPDVAGREQLLAAAQRNAERLGDVVNKALKLLDSERPFLPRQFVRIPVGEALAAAVDDVQPFVALRGQHLSVVLPEDLPRAVVDPSMLRDIVVNLLMNAIKFTPDGGALALRAGLSEPGRVRSGWWFEVEDEGLGISAEDRPHIFDAFFSTLATEHHSSGSYEYNKRGPGFGLALVGKFVSLHEGLIDVDSTPGQGSRFRVTLPLAGPIPTSPEPLLLSSPAESDASAAPSA